MGALRPAPLPLRLLRDRPGRPRRDRPEPGALRLQPLAELRRDAGDEESRQEVAAVELQRGLRLVPVERLLEGRRVAPEQRGIEADVFVAPPDHHRAQAAAEEMQALAQGVAALVQVELGPEQAEQGVAAVEAVGGGGGEVGQEGESLGL